MTITSLPLLPEDRQQHNIGNASVEMEFKPVATNEFAGLVAFQSEKNYYAIGKTPNKSKETVVQFLKSKDPENISPAEATTVLAELKLSETDANKPLFLKIAFEGGDYAFYYATKKTNGRY